MWAGAIFRIAPTPCSVGAARGWRLCPPFGLAVRFRTNLLWMGLERSFRQRDDCPASAGLFFGSGRSVVLTALSAALVLRLGLSQMRSGEILGGRARQARAVRQFAEDRALAP